jgi:cytidine deaminase
MLNHDQKMNLIQRALEAQKKAYVPYSHYSVGAALLAKSGQVFTGSNVENAVYPLTICAERTAVVKAVSEGEQDFQAIAVVTRDAGSPCGSCRQVLAEFGLDILVLIADEKGELKTEMTVAALLPLSFGPSNLLD